MSTARRTLDAASGRNGGSPCTSPACARAVAAQGRAGSHRWGRRLALWPWRRSAGCHRSVRAACRLLKTKALLPVLQIRCDAQAQGVQLDEAAGILLVVSALVVLKGSNGRV